MNSWNKEGQTVTVSGYRWDKKTRLEMHLESSAKEKAKRIRKAQRKARKARRRGEGR